ncbi:dual specificity protein phosphatase CDC14C-like [Diorhabda sublineata]|uniref:dual specificity protein phosphatase CDC14C-like n=1 Tax=Diorhabda sublineata TaxID=1163346 RepID=UPI0024E17F6A|nr:dual specificity protein phosphatase CDC14C-like [Diorhabda sublineata]
MNKLVSTPREVNVYVEIIHKQLYFAVLKGKDIISLKNNSNTIYFCIDDELHYDNFFNDFGPLNLSCLYKYCSKLNKYLKVSKGLKRVVHYTCNQPKKKTNAVCLMGLFCIMYLKFEPETIWGVLEDLGPYKPYLDVSLGDCGFNLKIIDCFNAIGRAMTFNFVDFKDFNVDEYDIYSKIEYGDLNWLIPRKFLAFIGPADNRTAHPPEFYIKYFLKNDVKTIIRLNGIVYNASAFTKVGIKHFNLIFPDGSTPPRGVLLKFLSIAEEAPAAIAVHCKAGLGRTGSLIGAYLVKHYLLTAREAIAWLRLCRPGSVIGRQQIWLEKMESWLWDAGNQYRIERYGAVDEIPTHKYGIYSKKWQVERENMLREARKKVQVNDVPKSDMTAICKKKIVSASIDSFTKKVNSQRSNRRTLPEDKTRLLHPKSTERVENKTYSPKQSYLSTLPSVSYDRSTSRSACEQKRIDRFTQGDELNRIKATWNKNKTPIGKITRPQSENGKYILFSRNFT